MSTNTVQNLWYEAQQQLASTIELVVFDICEVKFGLPIDKIDRFVNTADTSTLTDFETLDLHHRLFGINSSDSTHFIIAKSQDLTLRKIPVDRLPIIIPISIDLIKILPKELLTENLFGIVNHVAMLHIPPEKILVLIIENY
jgi:hypothetical protein